MKSSFTATCKSFKKPKVLWLWPKTNEMRLDHCLYSAFRQASKRQEMSSKTRPNPCLTCKWWCHTEHQLTDP